jgi:hypothetical protein
MAGETTWPLRRLTQNPAGFSMQWMQSWTVRPLLRVLLHRQLLLRGRRQPVHRHPEVVASARNSARHAQPGPQCSGGEKRSVTSAGTPQPGARYDG